jgi:hypothetical protein
VSAPLDFVKRLAAELKEAGIRFAITSGMACVHYGLQQTTKDSDWIIPPDDLEGFCALLIRLEGAMPPWRVAYRPVFGAPVISDYHQHGWTSHLALWDGAHTPEHHVDLFGRPPRVLGWETDPEAPAFASRHVVAQMKKTDRDKDWFAVDGLGLQEWLRGEVRGLLHARSMAQLRLAWQACPAAARPDLVMRRPVLAQIEEGVSDERLERLLHVERAVWQCVNRERYTAYQRAWKAFFRRWQEASAWSWPVGEPFWMQHQRVSEAARLHGLPREPLDAAGREAAFTQGRRRAANLTGADDAELALVCPPHSEILP